MRSQAIADALGISVRTVTMHRGNLMAKLGVSNVTELLALFHD
jgi:DNA-binding CsgD family transcriptional regulator